MPKTENTPIRSCGECLYRNPASGYCPKRGYAVEETEPACACFAVPFKSVERTIWRYPSKKTAGRRP